MHLNAPPIDELIIIGLTQSLQCNSMPFKNNIDFTCELLITMSSRMAVRRLQLSFTKKSEVSSVTRNKSLEFKVYH